MRSILFVGLCIGLAACSYIFELPRQDISATNAGDASLEVDGGEDLGDAEPIIPPPRFCERDASPSLLCTDFEDPAPLDLPTYGTVAVKDGILQLSSAVSLDARSLLASILPDGGATTAEGSATVLHSVAAGPAPDDVTFSFSQLVSQWNTANARLARLAIGGCSVSLVGDATVWSLERACAAQPPVVTATTIPIAPGDGVWHRFAIGVHLTPTPSVTLDIDGVQAATEPAPGLVRAPVSVGLGITLLKNGSATLFQDDVLVTSP